MNELPSLDQERLQQLVMNLAQVRGDHGFTREDVDLLLSEANYAYVLWLAFRGAIGHRVLVDVRDGDVVFLPPKGLAAYRAKHGYDRFPARTRCRKPVQ